MDFLKEAVKYKILSGDMDTTFLWFDVREPDEIAATGGIDYTYRIPLGMIEEILSLSDQHFDGMFRMSKDEVKKSLPLIFSCWSGVRSEKAARLARSLGYQRVYNYKGSAQEWLADKAAHHH